MTADCGSEPIRGAFAKILDLDNRAVVRQTMGTLSGVCAAHRTRGSPPVSTVTRVEITKTAIEKAQPGHPCTAVPSL